MNARWSGHQEDPTTSNVHSLASALTNMSPVSFSSVARHGLKRVRPLNSGTDNDKCHCCSRKGPLSFYCLRIAAIASGETMPSRIEFLPNSDSTAGIYRLHGNKPSTAPTQGHLALLPSLCVYTAFKFSGQQNPRASLLDFVLPNPPDGYSSHQHSSHIPPAL
eukprot:1161342-Pelagomonas_calceolata.AAC.13